MPVIVCANPLTDETFAPFGRLIRLAPHDVAGAERVELVLDRGDGWTDCHTRLPLLCDNASLGVSLGSPLPVPVRTMERHLHTEEALFCMDRPVALAVASAGDADAPLAAEVRAFVIHPGEVAVLNPGTWHDACHGLEYPAHYYWMATRAEGAGTPWMEIAGGPVTLERPA